MHRRTCGLRWGVLLAPLIGTTAFGANPADLAPQHPWRVALRGCVDSSGTASDELKALSGGSGDQWATRLTGESAWLAFQLAAAEQVDRVMVTFTCPTRKPRPTIALEEAPLPDGAPLSAATFGTAGHTRLATVEANGRLQHFEFTPRADCFYRLVVFAPDVGAQGLPVRLHDLGWFDLSGTGRKDYWLIIGASIQEQSIRQSVFNRQARKLFAGADPVVFNLAVSGWRTSDLREALPGFLAEHPHASFVGIHIGGNNVTPGRPYPGGADTIRTDLEAILTMIRDAGKVPILSRLSYRAYKGDKPVPPEENGSGPYVAQVYDPLIKEYCPAFYDAEVQHGVVDAYNWFKAHPDELAADGIHVNKQGCISWNRLWVENAGRVIYGPPMELGTLEPDRAGATREATGNAP